MSETEKSPGYAHTCADYPPRGCIACDIDRKEELEAPLKGKPPCHILVLHADKGPK
jgi:hypothetical protein